MRFGPLVIWLDYLRGPNRKSWRVLSDFPLLTSKDFSLPSFEKKHDGNKSSGENKHGSDGDKPWMV